MKKIELKQMSKDQLMEKLVDLRKDLMRLNTQRATKTVPENPANIKNLRRNVARVLTFMKQKNSMEVKTEKKRRAKKTKAAESMKFSSRTTSMGRIKLTTPTTKEALNTIEPKEFPTAMAPCFRFTALRPKISSGKVVPSATKRAPKTKAEIENIPIIFWPVFTSRKALKSRAARAKTNAPRPAKKSLIKTAGSLEALLKTSEKYSRSLEI